MSEVEGDPDVFLLTVRLQQPPGEELELAERMKGNL